MNEEYVVLVDDQDQEVEIVLKSQVHSGKTPLHRAFSIFIFNDNSEVLIQQRAKTKKTWPGIWSNSCCGHPLPGESREEAINRRVKQELGCEVKDIQKVSDYRYRFELNGVVENEICPIYKGMVVGEIKPNPTEVEDYQWVDWQDWLSELETDIQNKWSPWCKEEVKLFS